MTVDEETVSRPALADQPGPDRVPVELRGEKRGARDRFERLLNLAAALIAAVIAAVIFYGVDVLRDKTVPVLVLASNKAWSTKLVATDFVTVEMELAHNAKGIRASEIASVIGKRLTASLPAGSVVTWRELTSDWSTFSGQHMVGLRAERGQRPAQGLNPGALVCVAPLPAARPCDDSDGGGSFLARIADVGQSDERGSVVVDVIVGSPELGRAITAASGPLIIAVTGA